MEGKEAKWTVAQFVQLHKINKRMLHYYDNIGLFSPRAKGVNHYRYYEHSQGMEFELIRMMKELNMSIEQIRELMQARDEDRFLELVTEKQEEIEREIEKLERAKRILARKEQ